MVLRKGQTDKQCEPWKDRSSWGAALGGSECNATAERHRRPRVTSAALWQLTVVSKQGDNSQVALVRDILNCSCECGNLFFYCWWRGLTSWTSRSLMTVFHLNCVIFRLNICLKRHSFTLKNQIRLRWNKSGAKATTATSQKSPACREGDLSAGRLQISQTEMNRCLCWIYFESFLVSGAGFVQIREKQKH